MDNDLVVTVELLNTVRNRYDVMHWDASVQSPALPSAAHRRIASGRRT